MVALPALKWHALYNRNQNVRNIKKRKNQRHLNTAPLGSMAATVAMLPQMDALTVLKSTARHYSNQGALLIHHLHIALTGTMAVMIALCKQTAQQANVQKECALFKTNQSVPHTAHHNTVQVGSMVATIAQLKMEL